MSRTSEGTPARFTDDDVRRVLDVVDRLHDVEVRLELGDMKLHVRKVSGAAAAAPPVAPVAALEATAPVAPASAPAPAAARPPPAARPGSGPPSATAVAVRAPMLGRFFRAPAPTQPAYVEVGQRVAEGDPVCLVEVMKLFNTVTASVGGTVVRIDGVNGEMVEYDQPLFWVEPA